MRRLFTAGIISVFAGNLAITLLEKLLNRPESLEKLQRVLFFAESRAAAGAAYPPELLTNKMIAWVTGAFLAGLVLSLLNREGNKPLRFAVVLFYLCAAFINLYIVPHPAWITAAVPALFIVPFAGGLGLVKFIKEVKSIPEITQTPASTHTQHMEPAI